MCVTFPGKKTSGESSECLASLVLPSFLPHKYQQFPTHAFSPVLLWETDAAAVQGTEVREKLIMFTPGSFLHVEGTSWLPFISLAIVQG